jgi:hypothetical protein
MVVYLSRVHPELRPLVKVPLGLYVLAHILQPVVKVPLLALLHIVVRQFLTATQLLSKGVFLHWAIFPDSVQLRNVESQI